jgi:tripartite motif-containing protein 71
VRRWPLLVLPAACAIGFLAAPAGATPSLLLTWGSKGTGDGQFGGPNGIAVDHLGHVFVADTWNHRIQKFSDEGAFLQRWGSRGSGPGQFYLPHGIAVDAAGNVYVADSYNRRIQEFTNDGAFIRQWGSAGSGPGQFDYPIALDVDGAGYVYVSETKNNRIQKFTGDGHFVRKWSLAPSNTSVYPHVAVGPLGDVYVAMDLTDLTVIEEFDSAGVLIRQWGSLGSGLGQMNGPSGLSADRFGNIYVADKFNMRVVEFDGVGTFLQMWDVLRGPYLAAGPMDVAVDQSGNVFVVDPVTATVQKYGDAIVPATVTTWGRIKAERR